MNITFKLLEIPIHSNHKINSEQFMHELLAQTFWSSCIYKYDLTKRIPIINNGSFEGTNDEDE